MQKPTSPAAQRVDSKRDSRGATSVTSLSQKEAGAYYTPDPVVRSLLQWAVRDDEDRLLDPSCGDGRFIAGHRNAVGIEQNTLATQTAISRAPWALVHEGEFFSWAAETPERFDCAAGNPPFIRYQTFKGETRTRAIALCAGLGANFSGLASSWAPFLVGAASLLKPGGRMAFVVPAEIGHAPYAAPLLEYLLDRFCIVHLVAVRDKLFPDLSEDCWLLYADGFEGQTRRDED
jgi:adenine-specific DNA-methyltransferase